MGVSALSDTEPMALRLLLVDASPVMRSMFIRTLRLSAIPLATVHQAASAEEAVGVLRATAVDLVLADRHLPDQDGLALVTALRVTPAWASIPVILASATSRDDDAAVSDPGTLVIRRPFAAEEIRAAVLSLLTLEVTGPGDEAARPRAGHGNAP